MSARKIVILVAILVALGAVAVWLGLGKVKQPAPPTEAAKPESLVTVTLYFGAPDGSRLVPEPRNLKVPGTELESLRQVAEALVAGPTGGGIALVPHAAKIRGVYIDGQTAYIDFSQELIDNFAGGSTWEYMLVASIVQTVCGAFPDVQAVAILVGGQEVDTIGGHLDVSRPLLAKDWR
ncbi:MAG TPA: GerMN domain-containing protein [bacterium]|nr:GerMN domain-containing protein [bacterium]